MGRNTIAPLILLAAVGTACANTPDVDPPLPPLAPLDEATVATGVAARFSAWNPDLEIVEILETRAAGEGRGAHTYVLAHAIRGDRTYVDAFEDEAFGVFSVDRASARVLETLGYQPTCRWMDCEARITSATLDSVSIEWVGSTYGDQVGGRSFGRHDVDGWLIQPTESVGPITRSSSEADLLTRFGAAAQPGEVQIGEGYCSPGMRLFGDSPNEVEILWTDSTRSVAAQINVNGRGGDWRTPDGLYVGVPLAELERARGEVIEFSGFGWDYGGGTGWGVDGAVIGLQLGYSRQREEAAARDPRFGEILGDRTVGSDHPLIRTMDVRVERIVITWERRDVEHLCASLGG